MGEVTSFTYLRSIVSTTRGSEQDINAIIGKARTALSMLTKLWKSRDRDINNYKNKNLQHQSQGSSP